MAAHSSALSAPPPPAAGARSLPGGFVKGGAGEPPPLGAPGGGATGGNGPPSPGDASAGGFEGGPQAAARWRGGAAALLPREAQGWFCPIFGGAL